MITPNSIRLECSDVMLNILAQNTILQYKTLFDLEMFYVVKQCCWITEDNWLTIEAWYSNNEIHFIDIPPGYWMCIHKGTC